MTMPRRIGVYAGSFDPITNGHQWVIREGARLFDELIVAVGVNPAKKGFFSIAERLVLIQDAVADLSNVRVTEFSGSYLVHYAMEQGATHILRGIRGSGDLDAEIVMRHVNDDLGLIACGSHSVVPQTVFLIPPRALAEVSSSMVKGLVGASPVWKEAVMRYVTPAVLAMLNHKHDAALLAAQDKGSK